MAVSGLENNTTAGAFEISKELQASKEWKEKCTNMKFRLEIITNQTRLKGEKNRAIYAIDNHNFDYRSISKSYSWYVLLTERWMKNV